MLKSILLVCAGGLLLAALPARAVQASQQAAPAAQKPDQPQTAPAMEETPTAAPAAAAVADQMKNPVLKPTAESLAKAKQLYSIDCAMCHGDNGNGKTDLATSMSLALPDLTDPKALAGHMDGELFNVIRNGKDKMPGEDKARASDTEVWNLILYVRGFAKPQGAAPQTATEPGR